jgi:hypothetical protein
MGTEQDQEDRVEEIVEPQYAYVYVYPNGDGVPVVVGVFNTLEGAIGKCTAFDQIREDIWVHRYYNDGPHERTLIYRVPVTSSWDEVMLERIDGLYEFWKTE